MKFRDLSKQYEVLQEQLQACIHDVSKRAEFISGKEVAELEKQLCAYIGVRHCITCGNGTDALHLVLMAWDIGPGDAVFVPDFTFFASAEVVAAVGATPVFVDVEEDTFSISTKSLELAIERVLEDGKLTPRAIIPVNLYGLPANYTKLSDIASRYGLKILEDAAQGFGGAIGESRAGSFGAAAITSFFPTKPLGCYGDGGAIFTNDSALADLLRSLCVHGKGTSKYDNVRIGMNSRLDTLQAAILLVKLQAFKDAEYADINRLAQSYTDSLHNVVTPPTVPDGYASSWAQYTIRLRDRAERDALQSGLRVAGIPSMVYYPRGMSDQEVFKNVSQVVDVAVSRKLCDTVLSLPIYPYMTHTEQETVIEAVKRELKHIRNQG